MTDKKKVSKKKATKKQDPLKEMGYKKQTNKTIKLKDKKMKYEKTGKKVTADTVKGAKDYELRHIETSTIIWHLIKKHKFALMTVYALAVTAYCIFPSILNI